MPRARPASWGRSKATESGQSRTASIEQGTRSPDFPSRGKAGSSRNPGTELESPGSAAPRAEAARSFSGNLAETPSNRPTGLSHQRLKLGYSEPCSITGVYDGRELGTKTRNHGD